MANKIFYKNSYAHNDTLFRENFLLNVKIENIFKPESGKRAVELNSLPSSAEHNAKMIKGAEAEMQQPLREAVTSTRTEISKFTQIPEVLIGGIRGAAKNAASAITTPFSAIGNASVSILSGTAKIVNQLTTKPLGFVANIPRMGADAFRLAMRPPLIFADYLAHIVGRPSAWLKTFSTKVPEKVDHAAETIRKKCADIRDRALQAIEGVGGHTAHAAAHH